MVASDTYFGAAQTLQRPSSGYEPQIPNLNVQTNEIVVRSDHSNMTDLKNLP